MKRILIYMDINEIEYDIYRNTDYWHIGEDIRKERGGNCPNFGNKVWLQGLISEITVPDVEYVFWNHQNSIDEINEKFDCVINPCANIFSIEFQDVLDHTAEVFEKIKIPIYIISCGIQLNEYEKMDELIHHIEKSARRFIDAVYQSGGEFGLRGYYTKEFFDKLGYTSSVVTGCPSLYQMGRNLSVTKKNVSRHDFKAVVNAQNYLLQTSFYRNIFRTYEESVFIDQDHYFDYLYNDKYFINSSFGLKETMKRVKDKGMLGLELVASERLLLFADVPNWMMYLKQENYAMSFGARIHGNIMSILSGIPAIVHTCDCRTREMAEFYEIPFITTEQLQKHKDIYEIYEELDYTNFNSKFKAKYDAYEKFFIEHGIVPELNSCNRFEKNISNHDGRTPEVINKESLDQMKKELSAHKCVFKMEENLLSIYRKMKGKR